MQIKPVDEFSASEKLAYEIGKRDARAALLQELRDLLTSTPGNGHTGYTLRDGVQFVLAAFEEREAPNQ